MFLQTQTEIINNQVNQKERKEQHQEQQIFTDFKMPRSVVFKGNNCNEQLLHAEELVNKYRYDKMTDLKQRIDFDESFDNMIRNLVFSNIRFTFILIDINGLHALNREPEKGGYLAGDELIKSVARSLIVAFNKSLIYRIGGDEFAVLCSVITKKDSIDIFKNMSNIDDFCYSIIDSDDIDWTHNDARSIFLLADKNLTILKTKLKKAR